MRISTAVVFVVLAAGVAVFMTRNFSSGTNIDKRKAYWADEIAKSLPAGASQGELDAFAKSRGQALNCYRNYQREDQCDFDDAQSLGGSKAMPMKLAVIFAMKDGKVGAHQFTTTPANKPN